MGAMLHALVEQGFSLSASFALISLSSAVAAVGLYCTVPAQQSFYEQAARVLNTNVGSVAAQRPNIWRLKLQLNLLWDVLCVFPLLNSLSYLSYALATVGYMRWMSSWGTKYNEWFTKEEASQLDVLFESLVPLASILLNPLSGVVMDRIGLAHYSLIVFFSASCMAVLEPIAVMEAQQAFICSFALYIGTCQNVSGKWPIHFVPPHLFGVAYGSYSAFAGVCGGVFGSFLPAGNDMLTSGLLAMSSICIGMTAVMLLQRGLPPKPPKNKYDIIDHETCALE
eukprot:gnl/MRDRNA2_/MRDRNA2_240298_c0_seq1.p1 gnl/MRDRNA2_/MRDRNA2_240298_c0~~gnl/MRDRNA2_/MRDRNA2_240298_c0_seq1.p1  ORF type:complete len:329 (+),score=36.79 gnl/MRDRNA2_/MRDRNA2_240298_c0_seq1:142-987(+)